MTHIVMNYKFTVVWALPSDIEEIMAIEDAAFPEGIRESPGTFLERLRVFPRGNTVLLDENGLSQDKPRKLAGYFCSELWDDIPPVQPEFYKLGHSMEERHSNTGRILYISSLAAAPGVKGAGRLLFSGSLNQICAATPHINSIILLVNTLWVPARHIYETEGFRYTGTLGSFFTDTGKDGIPVTADGLLMQKDLS